MSDKLTIDTHFPTLIYKIEKPEFLEVAKKVSLEFLEKRKQETTLDEMYPCYMTEPLNFDSRMLDFANYVAQTAWNILKEQGYEVENISTYFEAMWCQEHHKNSLMEQHIHGNGNQIVGFYFLDVPDPAPRVVFYDQRLSKVQISLLEKNKNDLTIASNIINYDAKEGMLMFTNAYVPHSFSRNISDKPMRFIHFNVQVKPNNFIINNCGSKAEII